MMAANAILALFVVELLDGFARERQTEVDSFHNDFSARDYR